MPVRLNKIMRDLNVGLPTIVDFLQKKGIEVEEGNPNARISDDIYEILQKEFGKDQNQNKGFHPVSFENIKLSKFDVYLRFHEDIADKWDKNANNTMRFMELKSILTNGSRRCYFQKAKSDVKKNRSHHSIFIQLNDEKAIVFRVSLCQSKVDEFTTLYSYFVSKSKEVPFIKVPESEVYEAECNIHFVSDPQIEGSSAQDFQQLYKKVEALNLPKIELNKEKDKSIWKSYVTALKKLVREKEQIWKIKKISRPYQEDYIGDSRPSYIDIYINEKEMSKAFERDLKEFFSDELEDFGVNDENGFIEFSSFRELSQTEREKLQSLAFEYFYEFISQPIYSISGEIKFNQASDDNIADVYDDICQYMDSEYKIAMSIGRDGKINCLEKELPHVIKVAERRHGASIIVKKDSTMRLKVSFDMSNNERIDLHALKDEIVNLGLSLDRVKVEISEDGRQVAISVNSFIRHDAFSKLGLNHVKNVFSFSSYNKKALQPIDGLYIENGRYCADDIRIEKAKEILKTIHSTLSDDSYRILPTRYIFELPTPMVDIDTLREYKSSVDNEGSRTFSLDTSELIINASDADEYRKLISEIQEIKGVSIEDKKFSPVYYLKLKENLVIERCEIIQRIQKELRKRNYDRITYDSIKNYSRTLFDFTYNTEEERDLFVENLQKICDEIGGAIELFFDNVDGFTLFQFNKNVKLEADKEKEVARNVKQALFIYLTREDYKKYRETVEKDGDDAIFKGGISIGKLIRKEREKLKFRLETSRLGESKFEELLDRKDILEIQEGFIKPIFPGELTNISRMIKAMKKVTEPEQVGYPANANLSNFLFDPNMARLPQTDLEIEKMRIVNNLNEPMLKNQSKQLEAVAKALISPDIAIIQGPPGTGKTTVIAEIIWQTLLNNPVAKILITSQTNLAVDNALERLKGKKLVRPIRIGNIDKFEDEGKMYSDKRINEWHVAKIGTEEERNNSDNAVSHWINNVVANSDNSDNRFAPIVKKWAEGLEKGCSLIKTAFATEYLKQVNVFAATCSECGSRNFSETYQSIFLKDKENQREPIFDLVIVDEASKATPPELILPLTLGKRVVVIGDHKQLPPMIDENEFTEALDAVGAKKLVEDWTKIDYKTSQFEKLFVNAPRPVVASLDTQFRMHEQIMKCISQFYQDQEELENGLICGIKNEMNIRDFTNKASRWHGMNLAPFISHEDHAIWVNVDTPEEDPHKNKSYQNKGEVDAIKIVLHALKQSEGFKEYFDSCKKEEDKEIGIITYYMSQMIAIRNSIYPNFSKNEWRNFELHKYNNEFQIPFRINTVDRFQGMERNIIIISTVRSNCQKLADGKIIKNEKYPYALGFARECPRVNVGFSRVKRLLIVIGNEKHFSNKPEYAEAIQKMHRVDIAQLKNL